MLVRALLLLPLVVVACDRVQDEQTHAASTSPASPATSSAPVVAPSAASASTPAANQPNVQAAIAWLEDQVRVPAGDPDNPWALAHGLLAFGKDYKARDGRSAIDVIATFVERDATDHYTFPRQRNGKPVEPHTHLLVKTFLEIGLDPSLVLRTASGETIDVRRLLTDMRARVHIPHDDHDWHDAAWWLSALELDPRSTIQELTPLREAALRRLEADDAVITEASAEAFAPTAPMGAAKRAKSHIFGHPCGGLHFMQAVLRGVRRDAPSDHVVRVAAQLKRLLVRYRAEQALYAQTLRSVPSAALLVSGQQLKFFGHLLETLALADEVGLLRTDMALATEVNTARRDAATDVLAVIARLQQERAYARLDALTREQPQLALDLVGDGCHAIHGLRGTLSVLPDR